MKRKQRGGIFMGPLFGSSKIAKTIGSIGQQGPRLLATGLQIGKDVREGKNWKEAALDRIPEALKQVVAGKPFQLGSGIRRRRTTTKKRKATKKKRKHGVHSRRIV
jgi:hypothetical protein